MGGSNPFCKGPTWNSILRLNADPNRPRPRFSPLTFMRCWRYQAGVDFAVWLADSLRECPSMGRSSESVAALASALAKAQAASHMLGQRQAMIPFLAAEVAMTNVPMTYLIQGNAYSSRSSDLLSSPTALATTTTVPPSHLARHGHRRRKNLAPKVVKFAEDLRNREPTNEVMDRR